jgi:hypothetical protein
MKTSLKLLNLSLAMCWICASVENVRAQDTPTSEPVVDPLEVLGKDIERAAAKRDVRSFTSYFDFDTLFRTITANMQLPPEVVGRVRRAFDDSTDGFVRSVIGSLDPGGDYRFLKIMQTDSGPRLLFRMNGVNGLNYHQLYIATNSVGDLRIADIDIMMTGELLSQTLQRLLEQAIFRAGRGNEVQASQMELAQGMSRMIKSISEQKGNDALDVYDTLSEKTRRMRIVQLTRLQAALLVSDNEFQKAMTEYTQLFKDDPTADLYLIDMYINRQQFDRANAAIDRLDAWVGNDPVLDVSRSNIALARGNVAQAKALAQRAAQREAGLMTAHQQLLVISLRERDHAETLRLMRVLENDFKLQFGDLPKIPEFAEFVKSDEYRQWRRGGRPEAPSATSKPAIRF